MILTHYLAFLLLFIPRHGLARRRVGSRLPISPGFKHERINDKFLLTSTRESNWKSLEISGDNDVGCIRIDIHVPESFDPMSLCLKRKLPGKTIPGFHKDFKLRMHGSKADLSITDILVQNKAVDGFVIGLGVSFVNGYFSDNAFYGTLVYRHFKRDQIIHCSILPIQQLSEFVDFSKMDKDEKEELIRRRTVKKFRNIGANAIVACGDMHRHDDRDIKHPFAFTGPPNPTNVRIPPEAKSNVEVSGNRERRQAPPPPDDALPGTAPLPGAALGSGAAPPPPDMGGPPDPSITPKPTREQIKANKTLAKNLGKLVKLDKHGTYFATVCYIIDANYLERRFNGTPEQATLLLGGFVEMADWILRATDWNMDGIPDNIGMRLFEVNIQYITRELKLPDEKWGRADGGSFQKRGQIFNKIREVGKYMNPDCDIRSGIAEINVAQFVMHEPGGCTACNPPLLTSFVNPYVEKFSPRGEQLRLMYHQIRLLTFAFVHTNGYCANCSGIAQNNSKQSALDGTFENSDVDWGACIVEGDIQSRSNIPLNSFRLSVCSKQDGVTCLKELAMRNNCLQFEPEESYCGNGIVEGDEECDCGNLATCAEEQCLCSPRSGRDPCRKLSEIGTNLCFTLIRCRGFRFINEMGQGNATGFMAAFNTFVDGTNFRIGGKRASVDEDENNAASISATIFVSIGVSLAVVWSF